MLMTMVSSYLEIDAIKPGDITPYVNRKLGESGGRRIIVRKKTLDYHITLFYGYT